MSADPPAQREDVTRALGSLAEDHADAAQAADRLVPLVYEELKRLARGYLRHERRGHTLQPTALVHEAYLRLVDQSRVDWRGRTHFLAVGAQMMRRLLVDHARRQARVKHGAEWRQVTFIETAAPLFGRSLGREELLALDGALDRLKSLDERQATIVELRFFAGLKIDEVAKHLGIARRTVERDWTHARAWLKRELSNPAQPS